MENKFIEARVNENKQQIIDAGQKIKYNKSGLYEIKVCGKIVYVGKSKNMLHRIASHMYNIDYDTKSKKYQYLRKLRQEGYQIEFDVLEYVDEDDDKLGFEEAAAINRLLPILNLQIPSLDNYRKYKQNSQAKNLTYQELKNFLDNQI